MFGNFTIGGIGMSFGILLPALETYFEEGAGTTALVGSLLAGLQLVTCLLSASLSNRIGLRPVYMIGSLVAGTSLIVSSFSPSVSVLLLTYGVCCGIGLGLIMLPINVACNYYFEKRRALATGISRTGFSIGGFVFPPVSEFILGVSDWKAVLYMFAGLAFISSCFGALIRPLELAAVTKISNDENAEEGSDNAAEDPLK